MSQSLEKLDSSMKQLTLDLMKLDLMNYEENNPKYQKILNSLNQQYQACKVLLALENDAFHENYCFKQADINAIETILTNTGYIEESKKTATR